MITMQDIIQAKSQKEIFQLLVPLQLPDGINENKLSQAIWNCIQKAATPEERTLVSRTFSKPIVLKATQEPNDISHPGHAQPGIEPSVEQGKQASKAQADTEAKEPQPVQETPETPQPGMETVESERDPQSQPEAAEAESKAEIPDRVANLVERMAAFGPPKKAENVEQALDIPLPPGGWQEIFTDWNTWAEIPTGNPSLEDVPYQLKFSTKAEDRREHAARTWVREVSRTYHNKEGYWYLNDDGRWGLYAKEDLLNILEGADLFRNRPPGREAGAAWYRDKAKAFLRRVLTKNQVDFVGELAGHKSGVVPWKGDKYLIRKGPEIIEPARGDCSPVKGLLLDLLGEEQFIYLKGWAKTSYEALRDGEMSTGQMLVFSGPPGIGKSFVKEFIIRPILGGRHTDPTSYLHGKTNFNADTARAESWEIDDSVGTSDSNKRKMLTGAIKKLAASNDHRVEGKHKDGIQPPPVFHRLSVFTNDEAYDLWVLPEMTGSTADKAIILKAHKAENPSVKLPGVNEREAFRQQIEKALPAFIQQELLDWEIPDELKNGRYGIKAYQHKELAEALHQMSDEARLLEMIDILLPLSEAWEGTAGDLELELREVAKERGMSRELEKILWNRQALGNGLGKLRKTNSDRVELKKKNWKGYNVWVLKPRLIGADEEKPKNRKAEINY